MAFAELIAIEGIGEPQLHGVLGDADGARGRLDAGGFERRHQLLEALALDSSPRGSRPDREIVEAELVFLHAAIAEHAISPPVMPSAGNGSSSVPRGFGARNMERPR